MSFESVIEEARAILTEAEFTARWQLIEAWHQVGKLLLEVDGDITHLVKRASVELGRSERVLWHAVKFAKTYKTAEDLPTGKNISWNKVVREYLTDPAKPEVCQHQPITICKICKLSLDKVTKE